MTDNYEVIKRELDELKKSLEGFKENYYKKAAYKRENQKDVFDCIREKIDNLKQNIDDLFSEEAFLSADKWEKAANDKKQDIISQVRKDLPYRLKIIDESLRRIEIAQKEARTVIIAGIIVLVALIFVYMKMHDAKKTVFYDKQVEEVFFANLGQIKGELAKSQVDLYKVKGLLQNFYERKNVNDQGNNSESQKNKGVQSRVINDDLFVAAFRQKIAFLKGFASAFTEKNSIEQGSKNIAGKKGEGPLNNETATPPNNQTHQRIVILKTEIDRMEKEANALSGNDGYFWIFGYWRWLEVIFWGEFGVLVGILAWVSRKVEGREFTKERFDNEVFWYLTEVFIGPIVIVAAFFLLNQFIGTMMSGVSEEDVRMSIYLTLGISFALGLFLRRTLGIFDAIKKKLPLPGGKTEK